MSALHRNGGFADQLKEIDRMPHEILFAECELVCSTPICKADEIAE